MQGKTVAITGPTAGIGRASSFNLARQGASLILMCRSAEKGGGLADEIEAAGCERPRVVQMDLASLASVREAAETVTAFDVPLDVLLNNAGVVNVSRRETLDGFEETLGVNHLAPFLLTGLLLPALFNAPAPRVVNVSSAAHTFVRGMGFDDMQAERGYRVFREYGRSKLANILFTRSLSARTQSTQLKTNCLHPGAVATALGKNNTGFVSQILPALLKPFFKSPEQGAATSIYLASDDAVSDVSGEYFVNCKRVKPKPWAMDDEAAQRLWEFSESSVDFTYPL